jgi:hypothetical protein
MPAMLQGEQLAAAHREALDLRVEYQGRAAAGAHSPDLDDSSRGARERLGRARSVSERDGKIGAVAAGEPQGEICFAWKRRVSAAGAAIGGAGLET